MTKLLTAFLILSFSITSCGGGGEEGPHRRRPSGPRPERPPAPPGEHEPESLTDTEPSEETSKLKLPIVIDTNKHETIFLENADDKGYKVKITVSTKRSFLDLFPRGVPVSINAAFDGTASLKTTDNTYILSLSSSTEDKIFYFELNKKHSDVTFDEAEKTLEKGEKLASTEKPIIFYIKKDGELEPLCMSIKTIANIDLKNKFSSKDPDCP